MIFSTTLVSFLFSASAAFALPRVTRDDSPCAALGPTAYGNGGPYTLAAVNRSESTEGVTGVPLVLVPSVDSSGRLAAGNTNQSLARLGSATSDVIPTFDLQDGKLIAQATSSVAAGAAPVTNGTSFTFERPDGNVTAAPIYCAVVGSSPAGGNPTYPQLAVLNESIGSSTLGFFLCDAQSALVVEEDAASMEAVIYNPTADNDGAYDVDSCYPVYLQFVPFSRSA